MLATTWCQGNCQVYPWGKWEQYIIHIFLYFGSFIYWFSTQRCQSSFFSKMLSNIPSLLVPAFAKSFWAWYRWDENYIPFENKSFKYVHLKKKNSVPLNIPKKNFGVVILYYKEVVANLWSHMCFSTLTTFSSIFTLWDVSVWNIRHFKLIYDSKPHECFCLVPPTGYCLAFGHSNFLLLLCKL